MPADDLGLSSVFLRFSPATQGRFERETGRQRCSHLNRSILVGLLFYNAYNVSDVLLIPDIACYAIAARLLLITPGAMILAWSLPKLRTLTREVVVTLAMVGVVALPTACLAVSRSPFAGYIFPEIPLVLVYAGMMLVLNVTSTSIFAVVTAGLTAAAIFAQPAYAGPLSFAILLQYVTACAFVLYGNRQIEVVRRRAYLMALRETLRAENLEEAKTMLTALSLVDPLSGLANRRRLDEALLRHEHAKSLVALIMIDIDYFKAFNDAYGHLVGDACIKAVADALSGAARSRDLVARFGGEEFIVLVEGVDDASLGLTMERLRASVRDLSIPHQARPDRKGYVTVSAGGALLEMRPGASRELLALADTALYEAKKAGRDTHRIAAPAIQQVA